MTGPFPPRARFEIPLPGRPALVLGERTLLMGIVNVTPDSFSDGGRHATPDAAFAHARELIAAGADLLDIGGESTRPGSAEMPADVQIGRTVPLVERLSAAHPEVPLSIDTRSAAVASAAAAAGAVIVNDVSGLHHDPAMRATVADLGLPAILMHMRGTPADMREHATYDDLIEDILRELAATLAAARAAGIEHLIADPGFGFAKTQEQSLELLRATPRLASLGVPLLLGPSRKSFLALVTGDEGGRPPAVARHEATAAATALCAALGAHIVRLHDVRACSPGIRLSDRLR